MFYENSDDVTYDDSGVHSFICFLCAGVFANVPGYVWEKDPMPSKKEVKIAAFDKARQQWSERKYRKLLQECGMHNREDEFEEWRKKRDCHVGIKPALATGWGSEFAMTVSGLSMRSR